jgi:hypothetical protein
MTTHWKDNFKHFAMELLFSAYSVLEGEEELVEDEPAVRDNMEGGENEMRTFGSKARGKGRTLKDEQSQQYDDDLHAWRWDFKNFKMVHHLLCLVTC